MDITMSKSVFITGASYGTGLAIAERFAKEGYNVFLSSRDCKEITMVAKTLQDRYNIFAKGYQTTSFAQVEVTEIFADIKSSGYSIDTIVINTDLLIVISIKSFHKTSFEINCSNYRSFSDTKNLFLPVVPMFSFIIFICYFADFFYKFYFFWIIRAVIRSV